jgi:hypothetical protein
MPSWKNLQRIYEKNRSDFLGLVLRRYPDFILSNRIKHLEIAPAFTFHEVTKELFEPLLIYLSDNGYKTIDSEELFERNTSQNFKNEDEVVLTFDDGHKSLYEVAFPLLKKYKFKAVAFIIPGLIGGDNISGWQSENNYLCTWDEIKEMHDSGVIDFQAHSMYHHTIFVSPNIIDFVSPDSDFSFLREALFPVLTENDPIQFPDSLPLGTPIYESGYRYGTKMKYNDSSSLRDACQNYVKENGESSFFNTAGWRSQLNSIAKKKMSEFSNDSPYESLKERKEEIIKDLRDAKNTIEKKLNGKNVRHLCFPWFTASETTVLGSGEVGYVSNFWGGFIPKFAEKIDNPTPVNRFNPIYIWRLPGKQRKSISKVVQNKFAGVMY